MRRADSLLLLAGLALALLPGAARAACTVSATGVAFGAYDPRSATPDDSSGTIEVACHPSDHAPEVGLGPGLHGSVAARRMSSGSATLDYGLYANAGRTAVWGDGAQGSTGQTLAGGTVSGGTRRFTGTIYGRIPAGQNVPAGSYDDTLIVTISF
jgi:spore coat protein U-like protein